MRQIIIMMLLLSCSGPVTHKWEDLGVVISAEVVRRSWNTIDVIRITTTSGTHVLQYSSQNIIAGQHIYYCSGGAHYPHWRAQ
jgi:hypothetical protein